MTCRIAMISEHASPLATLGGVDSGGQNVYVGQVARALAALGHTVDIFTRRDSPHLPEIDDWQPGVRVIHVAAGPSRYVRKEALLPFMDEFTTWMLRFIGYEERGYDLIHANFWMSGLVAADLKRITGTPFVITFHALGRVRRFYQGIDDQFPDARFAIEDRLIIEADRIIAECPQDEEDLVELYHADRSKVTIIPCGFDLEELAPVDRAEARRLLGLDPDEHVILQLGRMVPRKGVETVIRGLARLIKDHGIAARLLIAGGDSAEPDPERTPEIGRLQAIALEEGVAEAVRFLGHQPRGMLCRLYSAADLFAVTPWYEPFGITPVEAMACGTPVIGSCVGGIKFSVRDGETGFLVPPSDPAALAERMAYVITNPELRIKLGRQGRRRARRLFTWRRVGGALATLYESVIAATTPCAGLTRAPAVVDAGFAGLLEATRESRHRLRPGIAEAAAVIADCFKRGGKLLACGNGGSAADAQHLAAELVGRFRQADRPGLPALALPADMATVTAWSNDYGFDGVFARQVEAFGRTGDVLLGISTSGRSRNLITAFEAARTLGMHCVALLGRDGGDLLTLADTAIVVPSFDTQRIQEVQMVVIHLICELVEEEWCADRPAVPQTVPSMDIVHLDAGGGKPARRRAAAGA